MPKGIDRRFVSLSNSKLVRKFYGREFGKGVRKKALLICHPNRISYSQAYPFLYYANEFRDRFGAQFRVMSTPRFEEEAQPHGADVVLLQTWLDMESKDIRGMVEKIKLLNPQARIHFLDSFAPTDLRWGKYLNGSVASYIKKSVLKERAHYLSPQFGDTNLSAYYSPLCNVSEKMVDWETPEELLHKIKIGPTFFTGQGIIEEFDRRPFPPLHTKNIDIHARIATKGTPWYQAMRELAMDKLLNLQNVTCKTGIGVSRKKFISEMRASKVCFSPFGYGEICWRDVEAIQCGSVLVKPSMEHVDMDPMIHIPDETYVPVSWDFTDLEDKVRPLLEDDRLRVRIASNAYEMIRKYIKSKAFVDQFAYMFAT